MLGLFVVPVLALRLAPGIRPFRWSRMIWTYCLPAIPLTLWLDGVLSCLRSYSQDDLHELVSGLESDGYRWEIGEERSGRVPITYVLGCPCLPTQQEDITQAKLEQIQMQRPA